MLRLVLQSLTTAFICYFSSSAYSQIDSVTSRSDSSVFKKPLSELVGAYDTSKTESSCLFFTPFRMPAGYSFETEYSMGAKPYTQLTLNWGINMVSPHYFLKLSLLDLGGGIRFNNNGKKDWRGRMTGADLEISNSWHILSTYTDSTVTDYLRYQFGLTIASHDMAGADSIYFKYFQVRNEIIFDKRSYPIDAEIVELEPDNFKFQARLYHFFGWSGYMAGDKNYPTDKFPVFDYNRAFETGVNIYLGILYQNHFSINSSVNYTYMATDEALNLINLAVGAYYLIPLRIDKTGIEKDGLTLTFRFNRHNIHWYNQNYGYNSLSFGIGYNGFLYPEIDMF